MKKRLFFGALKSALKEDATGIDVEVNVKYVTDESGKRTKAVVNYDPADIDHRSLALLQEMYYLNSAYNACMMLRHAENPELSEDIIKYKADMSGACIGASHSIMRHALPGQMKEKSYEQTVLRNAEGVAQWNSDMVQPRRKWLGDCPIEPLTR